jgi:hypothetical protein
VEVLSLQAIRSRLDESAATVAGTQRQAEEAGRRVVAQIAAASQAQSRALAELSKALARL